MQRLQQLGAGLAVDDGVVHLAVEREAAGRHAGHVVQALDDVGLPQRLAAVERPRVQARDLDAELPPVARVRQRDVAHVELDVDAESSTQYGRSSDSGTRHEPAAELRELLDARGEEAQHVLEAHLPPGAVDGS